MKNTYIIILSIFLLSLVLIAKDATATNSINSIFNPQLGGSRGLTPEIQESNDPSSRPKELKIELVYEAQPTETESEILFKFRKEFGTLGKKHIIIHKTDKDGIQRVDFLDENNNLMFQKVFDPKEYKKEGAKEVILHMGNGNNYIRAEYILGHEDFYNKYVSFSGYERILTENAFYTGYTPEFIAPDGSYYIHKGEIRTMDGELVSKNLQVFKYINIFSPNGKYFLASNDKKTVNIYDRRGFYISYYQLPTVNIDNENSITRKLTNTGMLFRNIVDDYGTRDYLEHYNQQGTLLYSVNKQANATNYNDKFELITYPSYPLSTLLRNGVPLPDIEVFSIAESKVISRCKLTSIYNWNPERNYSLLVNYFGANRGDINIHLISERTKNIRQKPVGQYLLTYNCVKKEWFIKSISISINILKLIDNLLIDEEKGRIIIYRIEF